MQLPPTIVLPSEQLVQIAPPEVQVKQLEREHLEATPLITKYPTYDLIQIIWLDTPAVHTKQPGPQGTNEPFIFTDLIPPPTDKHVPLFCKLNPYAHWLQMIEVQIVQLIAQGRQDWLKAK